MGLCTSNVMFIYTHEVSGTRNTLKEKTGGNHSSPKFLAIPLVWQVQLPTTDFIKVCPRGFHFVFFSFDDRVPGVGQMKMDCVMWL